VYRNRGVYDAIGKGNHTSTTKVERGGGSKRGAETTKT